MVISQLIQPKSIAVIGASDNTTKPGGMVLKNLINGKFEGKIFAVNPKPVNFQGVTYVAELGNLETVDLAIIAIPASQCLDTVRTLLKNGTKAFIIFSAGFSEAGEQGIQLEKELVDMVNKAGVL